MIVAELSLKLDYNDDDDTIHQSERCTHDKSSI